MSKLLLLMCWPVLALANDGVSGVSAGGIVFRKTDAIAMKKEVLNISSDFISVDYDFLNETASAVEETIAFPLPIYLRREDAAGPTYYGQPDGFTITVDGKPVAFTTNVAALDSQTRKPVTAQLKAIGLSDAQITFNPIFDRKETSVKALTPKQLQQLAKLGLVTDVEGTPEPEWLVQVNYVWKQTFAPNQIVKVHHGYHPFAETGPGSWTVAPGFAQKYCADAAFMRTWKKLATPDKDYPSLVSDQVGYILKTGNTWKNGIEDFTLNVIKNDPKELISLCFPGKAVKVDPKTYRFHALNFHPKDDLQIYFGNTDSAGGYRGVMPTLAR